MYFNCARFAGEFPQGCRAFSKVSANVDAEEAGMKDDLGMQDVQYSMVLFLKLDLFIYFILLY